MRYAAQNHKIFHLWFHPHNLGKHLEQNLEKLEAILVEYSELRQKSGMRSVTMAEMAEIITEENKQRGEK